MSDAKNKIKSLKEPYARLAMNCHPIQGLFLSHAKRFWRLQNP